MMAGALALVLALSATAGDTASPPAGRYVIDPKGSMLTWELPATLHTVHGKVPELSGSFEIEAEPSGEFVVRGCVAVRAAAMTTGNGSRDRTMREDTLEVAKFPEIVFELRRVVLDWTRVAPGATLQATAAGELTVHGKALALEVPVRVEVSETSVTVSGAFDLRWKAFGLKDPSFGFVTVREPMKVSFRLRAVLARGEPKSGAAPV